MIEDTADHIYREELFDRLRKSAGMKRETECFGRLLKTVSWWIVEKESPKLPEVEKAIFTGCSCAKGSPKSGHRRCAKIFLDAIGKAAAEKRLVRTECSKGLHGFVYPILHSDRLFGYIGACYSNDPAAPEVLDMLGAFTDTLVREVQKEHELSKLYETLRPRAIALSTVHTVHRLISSTLDLNELLPRIARLSLQIMRANRCSIKLVDSKRKILLPKVTVDLRAKKIRLKKVRVGMFAPGKAFKFGRPIRGRNYLSAPLIDADVIGVITLYDKIDDKPFTQFDQEIISTLAEQAVIAIKNAQLYKEQEKLTTGTIKALAKVLDSRAPGTYIPRASFVKIAIAIGQELHLDSDLLKSLEYASILHDAGEIFVPQDVLAKPTKLTGEEFAMVKGHPAAGVEIIRHMKALKSATPIILYHHENFDGSGYPKGLKKDQIPVGARIMAVVSAFESMISKKPYRVAKTVEEAVEEIRRNSGTQFDPKIVDLFLKVMKRKDIRSILEKEAYAPR
jgi:HD-GYP domain-containing protein (c-di-GMP phosphodiesterase class II)